MGLPSALRIYHGLDARGCRMSSDRTGRQEASWQKIMGTLSGGWSAVRLTGRTEAKRTAAGGTAEQPFAMRMKDVCFRYGKDRR